MRCRRGIKPEDHARKNAKDIKLASQRNRVLRQGRRLDEEPQSNTRRTSARSTVSSSGYGTSRYQPRCADACMLVPMSLQCSGINENCSCVRQYDAPSCLVQPCSQCALLQHSTGCAGALRLPRVTAGDAMPSPRLVPPSRSQSPSSQL